LKPGLIGYRWEASPTDVEVLARVCHEANRAYCGTLGEVGQLPWDEAPDWQKESARRGVELHLRSDNVGPEESHNSWMEQKLREGWRYGEGKDVEAKVHPCLLPYKSLPTAQKVKDYIFAGIVAGYVSAYRADAYRRAATVAQAADPEVCNSSSD